MPSTISEYLLMEFKCLSKEDFDNLSPEKQTFYKNIEKYHNSDFKTRGYYKKNKEKIIEKQREKRRKLKEKKYD